MVRGDLSLFSQYLGCSHVFSRYLLPPPSQSTKQTENLALTSTSIITLQNMTLSSKPRKNGPHIVDRLGILVS
jgi:hypothetical protein